MDHITTTWHMPYDINPFIFLQKCFKQHEYLFFKRKKKKPTNLKTYLFVKLLFLNEEKHNFLKIPII